MKEITICPHCHEDALRATAEVDAIIIAHDDGSIKYEIEDFSQTPHVPNWYCMACGETMEIDNMTKKDAKKLVKLIINNND